MLKAQLGIRVWVLAASLLATLPLLLYAVWTVRALHRERIADSQQQLRVRTQAAAQSVQRRFDRAIAALQAQAASPAALAADLPGLAEQARRTLASHDDGAAIRILGTDGEPLSLVGTGAQLFGSVPTPAWAQDFSRASISSLMSTGDGHHTMAISVPVVSGGKHRMTLQMMLPDQAMTGLLMQQGLPPSWIAAILDADGLIAGRTHDATRWVGQHASPTVLESIAAERACPFHARSIDGVEVTTCALAIGDTGWHVAIGVPSADLEGASAAALRQLLAVGLACLGLGAGAAVWVANHIRHQAASVGDGAADTSAPNHRRGGIREMAAIGREMAQARSRVGRLSAELDAAERDPLTGLPTRARFEQDARAELADPTKARLGVAALYLDLDGFKAVNDRLGHAAGDQALRDVAGIVSRTLRSEDLAVRLGGDEFVVLLRAQRETLVDTAQSIASRLVRGIGELGHGLGCTVGIALAVGSDVALEALLARADAAMLQAKRAGKNRWHVATGGIDA